MSRKGIIFNVQRFTIHDGPGLRTELFFKGCPLRCEWCSNPESWHAYIQPGVYKSKCITRGKCGSCVEECPEKEVLRFVRGRLESIDRSRCSGCMLCYDACPSDAIKQWGTVMTVEECMKEILRDRGYYERSGGGMTISGGEPLVQSDFAAELLKACREEKIHTCFETTLYADWKEVEKILPYTDLLISDIKHMNPELHRKYTGGRNDRILANLKRIAQTGQEIILRIPVIPGVNDDRQNLEASADFILGQMGGRVRTLQLLSFMRLGEEKYRSLGIPYKMEKVRINRKAFQRHVEKAAEYFNRRGIHCVVGTKEKQEI